MILSKTFMNNNQNERSVKADEIFYKVVNLKTLIKKNQNTLEMIGQPMRLISEKSLQILISEIWESFTTIFKLEEKGALFVILPIDCVTVFLFRISFDE